MPFCDICGRVTENAPFCHLSLSTLITEERLRDALRMPPRVQMVVGGVLPPAPPVEVVRSLEPVTDERLVQHHLACVRMLARNLHLSVLELEQGAPEVFAYCEKIREHLDAIVPLLIPYLPSGEALTEWGHLLRDLLGTVEPKAEDPSIEG